MPERPSPWVAAFPALALFAFWRVLAQATPRPADAAEAAFLALPVAVVALAAVWTADRELPVTLCLMGLAAVALLPGPGGARAALTGVLCGLTLAVGPLSAPTGPRLADWVAVGIALQALFSPRLLLAPETGPVLVRLVVLPATAAWAADRLARSRSPSTAAIAAASAAALEGGVGPVTCAGLLLAVLVDRVPRWRRARLERPAAGAALAAAATLAVFGRATGWARAGELTALLPLALPAAAAAAPLRFLVAVAVALGAVRLLGPHGAALVPAALILALGPAGGGGRRRLQLAWSLALVAGGAVAAFYPWLRPEPLAGLRALLPVAPGWGAALTAVAVLALLAATPRPRTALAALLLAAALHATPYARTLLAEPVTLDAERPSLSLELDAPEPLSRLTVDSYLTGAGSLPAGTEVGELDAVLDDGATRRRPLLVARDTVDRDGPTSPAVTWLADVPPTGGRFGRSARTRWSLAGSPAVRSLTVRLRSDLPPGARLVVLWVGGAR